MAAASNAALQQDVQTLQEETAKLQTELEDVLEQFDGIQQEANEVETQVVDEVSCHGWASCPVADFRVNDVLALQGILMTCTSVLLALNEEEAVHIGCHSARF